MGYIDIKTIDGVFYMKLDQDSKEHFQKKLIEMINNRLLYVDLNIDILDILYETLYECEMVEEYEKCFMIKDVVEFYKKNFI